MIDIKAAARGRGRPRKSPDELAEPLVIRLTSADRERIRRLAKRDGISISTYIVGVLKVHLLDEDG